MSKSQEPKKLKPGTDPAPTQSENPLKREIDAKARGTKQKIILAAINEFAEHGLEGARVDRIAKSARVNKAMIYYHFDSKEILYKEVLVSFYRQLRDRAQTSVLSIDSLEQALLALARLHAESILESPQITPLVLREMLDPDPERLDAILAVFASSGIPKRIISLLQQDMDREVIRKLDVRHVMVSFVSMSLGYFAIAPMTDRIFDIADRRGFVEARPEIMVDIFLNGLKAR